MSLKERKESWNDFNWYIVALMILVLLGTIYTTQNKDVRGAWHCYENNETLIYRGFFETEKGISDISKLKITEICRPDHLVLVCEKTLIKDHYTEQPNNCNVILE